MDYYFLEDFFLGKPPDKYSCPICLSPVQREAFLTQCCGNHFCFGCIRRIVVQVGSRACPMCNSPTVIIFPNKERQREIKAIQVNCPVRILIPPKEDSSVKVEGAPNDDIVGIKGSDIAGICGWVGELGSVDSHLKDCHGDDKRWQACGDEASSTNGACMVHLNRSLQQMNMQTHYHHLVHPHRVQISVSGGASNEATLSNHHAPPLVSDSSARQQTQSSPQHSPPHPHQEEDSHQHAHQGLPHEEAIINTNQGGALDQGSLSIPGDLDWQQRPPQDIPDYQESPIEYRQHHCHHHHRHPHMEQFRGRHHHRYHFRLHGHHHGHHHPPRYHHPPAYRPPPPPGHHPPPPHPPPAGHHPPPPGHHPPPPGHHPPPPGYHPHHPPRHSPPRGYHHSPPPHPHGPRH